uniref:uncharacterized protein si:ch211-12e13.1 isoform X1 n=1 Tax=Solea senegalensis TaxID=28829 RepID=UPI001CD87DCE|nr:uncharacterized protein si:ch211-12e13.1 isoform X1 [Solea senegalensis]
MRNARSFTVASFAVCCCSVYLVYVHIYRSRKLLKTNVLTCDRLPSLLYLYLKYLGRALTWRTGYLHRTPQKKKKSEAAYTVLRCRLETATLRRFCTAAGYGWDYPDSEFRDIPLCFPEFLCGRLMLMLLTDDNFRLNPAGLVRVCQILKTLQPIDELKKGPFTLQVRVLVYRQTDVGVEVDVCLSATSRSGSLVWESVLTLLSKKRLHRDDRGLTQTGHESRPPDDTNQVELSVLWRTNPLSSWSFSDSSLHRLLSLSPVGLLGCGSQTAPSLWMLSVCLAEIEKHRGVDVVTAPVEVMVQFQEPVPVPGRVTIRFWEMLRDAGQSSALSFHMQQPGGNMTHMTGMICRS